MHLFTSISLQFVLIVLSFAAINNKFLSEEVEEESDEDYGEDTNDVKRFAFSGFKLYKIQASTKEQISALGKLFEEEDGALDFWRAPGEDGEDGTEVMVARNQESNLKDFLQNLSMNYSVVIQDIERLVAKQYANMQRNREKPMSWTEYHYPETIFSWLNSVVSTRSDVYVNSTTIGLTVERRPIKMIKISSGGIGKRGVFIDGGIHAREWISSAVVTYIVNELTTNTKRYESLLNRYDFYIVPLLNPDGYAHSCNYNRLWRKSRKANDMLFGLIGCRGVDLNRNWGFSWGGRGASTMNPCSLIYGGTRAFSEPETAAVRDFIESDENAAIDWIAYFSLHSFGQKWLTPWGYKSELPEDYEEMERVAKVGVAGLRAVHGTRYSVGATSNILYAASGSSMDWFKGHVGVKYSYTLELRDYGLFGFLLPAYQIIPTAEESWAGMQKALLAIPPKDNKKI